MSAQGWAEDPERAAGGRRRYNALRRDLAAVRRAKLMALILEDGGTLARGTQARMARRLGVSEATISRDVVRVFAEYPPSDARCPICRDLHLPDYWPFTTPADRAAHEAEVKAIITASYDDLMARLGRASDARHDHDEEEDICPSEPTRAPS